MKNRDDVIVTLHDLPTTIHGALSIDNDGTPCIHLNARLSIEAQRKAFNHEMEHLERNDFCNHRHISDIEP